MATAAQHWIDDDADGRFVRLMAGMMVLVLVAGFSLQLALGRSSFSVPLVVHVHAVVFFGWTFLFAAQSWLGTRGPIALHRRLGWIGAGWLVAMVILGVAITVTRVRQGAAPFFFQPQHFLISNSLLLALFVGLAVAAIRRRRTTDWHWRLHLGAMSTILGPGFGRLLPMPLFIPYAFEIGTLAGALFPVAGMVRDLRRDGRVHPAWWWSVGGMLVAMIAAQALAHSLVGAAIYEMVTEGAPGAAVPGLAVAPPPPGM